MKELNKTWDKDIVFIRRILSFLAMDAEDKRKSIPITEDWFHVEKTGVNDGANYLIGTLLCFDTYYRDFSDLYHPDDALIIEFEKKIRELLTNRKSAVFSMHALNKNEWKEIQVYAKKLLLHYDLPTLKVLDCKAIENTIRFDEYSIESKKVGNEIISYL